MSRKSIVIAIKAGCTLVLFFLFLFNNGIGIASTNCFGTLFLLVGSALRDPTIQWIAVLGLTVYLFAFLVFEFRQLFWSHKWIFAIPNLWFSAFVVFILLRYSFSYGIASNSTQVPDLLVGIVFGKAVSALVRWQNNNVLKTTIFLIHFLICFFACVALSHPKLNQVFQYHGVTRLTGIWDNPNLYGILMGVGLVLTIGSGIQQWKITNYGYKRTFYVILFGFATFLCGYGLLKSYSRGAWLGALSGFIYLIFGFVRVVQERKIKAQTILSLNSCIYLSNRFAPLFMAISVMIICFWQFRFSEFSSAQRIFSVLNINDFSWRNRLTAWNGAIHMMSEKPMIGFGWGQAEPSYETSYCLLNDSAAIEMNDFLMLGISAGIPALFCFIACIAVAYRGQLTKLNKKALVSRTCSGGAIVFLVGFWFDGGLFKLAISPIFWTLFELSQLLDSNTMKRTEIVNGSLRIEKPMSENGIQVLFPSAKRAIWFFRLTMILIMLATIQSVIYLGIPFLSVNDETSRFAKRFLISPKDVADFNFLLSNSTWDHKQLRLLLEHLDLASYNRRLVNWKEEDKIYQHFVLSPIITGQVNEQLNWRRQLWEEFYPRISHESSIIDAVQIIFKHLREHVAILALPNLSHDVSSIWINKKSDETGFQITYIATLRSVGIPARLDSNSQTEFWTGNKWRSASSFINF